MSEAKIDITIGQIHFAGEGDQTWLESQLDKILNKAIKMPQYLVETSSEEPARTIQNQIGLDYPGISKMPLPSFLSEKNATTNQVRKFLCTAVWLMAKGKDRLQTTEITKALRESHQSRLGNPADCLQKNIAKGYCEKNGKEFFVTEEGRKSL